MFSFFLIHDLCLSFRSPSSGFPVAVESFLRSNSLGFATPTLCVGDSSKKLNERFDDASDEEILPNKYDQEDLERLAKENQDLFDDDDDDEEDDRNRDTNRSGLRNINNNNKQNSEAVMNQREDEKEDQSNSSQSLSSSSSSLNPAFRSLDLSDIRVFPEGTVEASKSDYCVRVSFPSVSFSLSFILLESLF